MTYRPCCSISPFGSFSITQHVLLWPDQSQAIAPCGQDLIICFTPHEPCACFTYCLYLRLLYLLWKRRKFFTQIQTQVHSALFHLIPSPNFALLTHFTLSHHPKPLFHITSHSLIPCQETIPLLPNHTPQSHIGFILRSLAPLIFSCILGYQQYVSDWVTYG